MPRQPDEPRRVSSTLIGGRMIRSSLRGSGPAPLDPSRGAVLMGLSMATSIDALAMGFSLALLQVDVWQPAVIIGLVTAGLSLICLKLGSRLGARFGTRTEFSGGVLLILIGARIPFEHLSLGL